MVDARTLAAAVLGVALGLLFVLAPATVVRVHAAGRLPTDRHGRYGADGTGEGESGDAGIPTRWLLLVRAAGVALLLGGLYFGWTLL